MKKAFLLFLSFSVILILSACSVSKSEQVKVTENFLNALVVNHDGDEANKYLSKEMKELLILGGESLTGTVELSESEEFKKFEENLKEISKKTKYTVEDSEEENKVKVSLEYADISEPMKEAFNEFFTKAFSDAFSGETISEEESAKMLYQAINLKLENFTPEIKKVESIVELKDENGKVVINKVDNSLIEALSYGFNLNIEG